MLFTDPLFLFYFLPLALLALRICTPGARLAVSAKIAIIVATLVFYAYGNWLWPVLFMVVVGGTYAFALAILSGDSIGLRRAGLVGSVLWALLALSFFKYLNWLATLVPSLKPLQLALVPYFGKDGLIELPPGISFYVFEALSFAVDAYRGKVARPVKWLDYLTFLAMFPRFIAGPIVRYPDISAQFKEWCGQHISRGLSVFAMGFMLKSLLADQFAVFVPYAFSVHKPDLVQAWIGAIAYTFQLYFDFWGYSLMAIGLGMCLGFSFPDNFRAPYHASSIAEFWRRWHISLSQWLRDYLYISLGGNRRGTARTYLNLFLTMAIGGLWHGANFTFLAWGAYHGLLLAVERALGEARLEAAPMWLRRALTLLLVVVGWVLFRSESFDQAVRVLSGMAGIHGTTEQFNGLLLDKHLPSAFLAAVGLVFWARYEPRVVGAGPMADRSFGLLTQYLLFGGFLLALLFSLSSREIPFLYFQF